MKGFGMLDIIYIYIYIYMLRKLGFGEKWIGWIKQCLVSTHISVLVNVSLINEFIQQRDLR